MRKYCTLFFAILLVFVSVSCDKKEEHHKNITLTWWVPLFSHVENTSASFSDNELYKELMKRTGVNIEFVHPKGGASFEVLLMSNDLPDMIEHSFFNFKGGPQAALDEKFIIGLDSFMERYSPNYTKVLKENPMLDKEVTTENGSHYTYAWLRGDESLLYWKGLQIRTDLLEQANLPIPKTIEEWDNTLRKFKDMGIKYPLTYTWNFEFVDPFASAFNTLNGYYQIDGKVKFSPLGDNYIEYVKMLNTWYLDGLLDPEFLSQSEVVIESKIQNGQAGAYIGSLGGSMGNCISELKKIGAGLAAAPTPVKNYGDNVFQSQRDSFYQPDTSVSISGNCDNIKEAARVLDYGYSEEGHLLYNFGIEGISYEMVDGYPKYLPEITNNSEGLSMQHAMSKYMASAYGGPCVQDKRAYEQYLRYPEQKQAVELWSRETQDHKLPQSILIPAEFEKKERRIEDYCNRTIIKFITGEIPLSEYDNFVSNLQNLGVEEIIELKQESLDKYYSVK